MTSRSRSTARSRVTGFRSGPDASTADPRCVSWGEWLLAVALAALLTVVFWSPLWRGGGLIGGDLYPYYLPQKSLLAESLKAGEIPLWNPRVGFGYPVLGESQTGALYPPHLLYGALRVNTAYNVVQLGHYIVTFLAAFGLSRRLGLATLGALLAATAFTYGWFPARICLEWAIIGGMWFALILWIATVWLQTGRRRCLPLLSVAMGLALLAGHYNLLFIALLALLPWPWLTRGRGERVRDRPERLLGLAAAVCCGFLTAGVQLLPTWELKQQSQRQRVNDAFAPTYGHLPPRAVSQLWMPWAWYAGERTMDEQLQRARTLALPTATNQAEAQLYLGMLPLALALLGWTVPRLRRELRLPHGWGWLGLTVASLVFATGWPTYWLSSVPGIGFFRGPGRYSIVAVLALALAGGATLDVLVRLRGWGRQQRGIVGLLLLGITTLDLWAASRQYRFGVAPMSGRQVFYATLLDDPPINHLEESPLRDYFASLGGNVRLYAPGQNMPTLLGVSAIPVYLGLGPELYESEALRIDVEEKDSAAVADAVDRLRRFGVTHLLLESALPADLWPVDLLGRPLDPLLNRCFARREPFFLYQLREAPGRVSFASGSTENKVRDVTATPHRVRVTVELHSPDRLILRDLDYPGWRLETGASAERTDDIFRAARLASVSAPGETQIVEWVYRPASVMWGLVVSLLGILGTCGLPWGARRLENALGRGEQSGPAGAEGN